jgi:hypothetical protein
MSTDRAEHAGLKVSERHIIVPAIGIELGLVVAPIIAAEDQHGADRGDAWSAEGPALVANGDQVASSACPNARARGVAGQSTATCRLAATRCALVSFKYGAT